MAEEPSWIRPFGRKMIAIKLPERRHRIEPMTSEVLVYATISSRHTRLHGPNKFVTIAPSDCLFVVIVEHIATAGEHERGRGHHQRCAPVYSAEQKP